MSAFITQVGLKGEAMKLVSSNGVSLVDWMPGSLFAQTQQPLTWYKFGFGGVLREEPGPSSPEYSDFRARGFGREAGRGGGAGGAGAAAGGASAAYMNWPDKVNSQAFLGPSEMPVHWNLEITLKVGLNFEVLMGSIEAEKAYFNSPDGDEPLALDMGSMAKGQVWINGQSIGRYWTVDAIGDCTQCSYSGTFRPTRCQLGCGQPTQRWYHVPRAWLKPTQNQLVIFEELLGDVSGISIVKRSLKSV
ncbi:hypothetical protein U1Q18_034813 [Sarracenia purpurea var. burkii]